MSNNEEGNSRVCVCLSNLSKIEDRTSKTIRDVATIENIYKEVIEHNYRFSYQDCLRVFQDVMYFG